MELWMVLIAAAGLVIGWLVWVVWCFCWPGKPPNADTLLDMQIFGAAPPQTVNLNTCGTCKFRGKEDGEGSGYFLCGRIQHEGRGGEYKKGHGAAVIDGSGYFAALCVETDFGCTAWGGLSAG